ncbi:hypothetical protein GCM10011376_17010 [Nocardioides flavus (ex Wang et al. 2016)]|uniref:Uncharacterized protein n=1 Tax=Nocardioides flavus (ex Wang et al. 2016) TaxID=2058780 RepID=A0ABQ3HIH2_9ACTN|nr:hypothetical protein [Nocardioides flavus (ex Wang et al. 2016)]GHE17091.1 hypothetical protein GCM10011376_17010 [Nocardioides flavus (ex Wang et al. 2016)]
MTAPRRLVHLASLALVLALPAAPAAAEQARERDASGDMIRVEEGGGDPQAAPTARVGDVVRTTFRHDVGRVVVRTRFAALERAGRRFTVWADVQDRPGHTWYVGVQATRRDRGGETILMDGRGRDLPCTARHRIRYGADTVRVAVPRSCFGDPERLRFRLLSEHVRRSWDHAWLDNGLAPTMDDRRWTAWLTPG